MQTTDLIEWLPREEWFRFCGVEWNVRSAKAILDRYPRPILDIPTDILQEFVGEPGHPGYLPIDWARAEETNLDVPLIGTYTTMGNILVIDGWHRVAKALRHHVKTLPVALLTPDESRRISR